MVINNINRVLSGERTKRQGGFKMVSNRIPGERESYEKFPTLASLENYEYMAHSKRKHLAHEITDRLEGKQKRLYVLVNFLIIGPDRLIDYQIQPPEFLLSLKELIEKVWKGEVVKAEDPYEKVALEFTGILRELRKEGLEQAESIFNDLLFNLTRVYENIKRRGQILSKDELKEVSKGDVEAAFASFLQSVSFALTREEAWQLAEKYGLAAKEADDLVDVAEDLGIGLIGIPKEDINHLDMEHLRLDKSYAIKRLQEIENIFREGDQILEPILKKLPEREQKRVILIRDLFYTWLEDARKVYSS